MFECGRGKSDRQRKPTRNSENTESRSVSKVKNILENTVNDDK